MTRRSRHTLAGLVPAEGVEATVVCEIARVGEAANVRPDHGRGGPIYQRKTRQGWREIRERMTMSNQMAVRALCDTSGKAETIEVVSAP